MNIHHLELFYYVSRHGGISEAVRNMPYGIQQPAVSAQILQLEGHLGISLFQRRPFCLTPAGDKLYRFIQPFFDNLGSVAEELRGGTGQNIRIGASDVVLKDHLPALISRLQEKFPGRKLTLRGGYQPDLIDWLRKHELDLALTVLDKNLPSPLQALTLLKLPMVLLANKKTKVKRAEDLWAEKRVSYPLLCLPPNEVICKLFQEGLRTFGVDWTPSIELSSLELIATYVENDHGFGLGVDAPGLTFSTRLKVLPLEGFPLVEFGAIWQGSPSAYLQNLLVEVQNRANEISGVPATKKKPAARPPEFEKGNAFPAFTH